jgi:tyrosyl-tRNA synthetase
MFDLSLYRDLLSEFDYWQFWRNTADADVIKFLKLFTEVPLTEINKMAKWEGAQLNAAKQILADEATKLLHGSDCLPTIHATAASLFGSAGKADMDSLPKVTLPRAIDSAEPISVVELLVKAELVTSKSEAKRLIKNGGAKINDQKVDSDAAVIAASDFDDKGRLKLSSGKKTHVLVVLQ